MKSLFFPCFSSKVCAKLVAMFRKSRKYTWNDKIRRVAPEIFAFQTIFCLKTAKIGKNPCRLRNFCEVCKLISSLFFMQAYYPAKIFTVEIDTRRNIYGSILGFSFLIAHDVYLLTIIQDINWWVPGWFSDFKLFVPKVDWLNLKWILLQGSYESWKVMENL